MLAVTENSSMTISISVSRFGVNNGFVLGASDKMYRNAKIYK